MRQIWAAILVSAIVAAPVSAAQIRYDFTGTFTTSQTGTSFAQEGGFTSGTGSYGGYVIFDLGDPGPTDFTAIDAVLSIGNYSFQFTDPLFSFAGATVSPPDFTLNFISAEDFSTANNSELLSFQISFPTSTPGIDQSPDPATGSAVINFAGDADALNGTGVVTSFTSTLTATAVPEPGSWALMIGGLGLFGGALRWRRARQLSAAQHQ